MPTTEENRYEVGDYVTIRAEVTEVHGPEHGYTVRLFSKTDEYLAIIRPDLITGGAEPPLPYEPDHEALVIDKDGDSWRWSAAENGWSCSAPGVSVRNWPDVVRGYGPLKVYERVS